MCAAAGANNFDGASVTRFNCTQPRLDDTLNNAENQGDLFSFGTQDIQNVAFDCAWQ